MKIKTVTKRTGTKIKNMAGFGNNNDNKEIRPVSLKSFPPSWWVLSQTNSLDMVQGVRMPTNQSCLA